MIQPAQGQQHSVARWNKAGLVFIDNRRLIVYEVGHDVHQLAERENADHSSPFRLHLHLVDADSGAGLAEKDWGTRPEVSSVQVAEGGILLQTGDETLRVLTPDLAEMANLRLSSGDPKDVLHHWGRSIVSVSATGKTVLINRFTQPQNFSRLDVLDGNTFNLRSTWKQSPPLYKLYSISDHDIAAANNDQNEIFSSSLGTNDWKPFGNPLKLGCIDSPVLIDDHRLLVEYCNQLLLLSPKTSLVLDTFSSRENATGDIKVSQDGRFAAVAFEQRKITKHILSEPSVKTLEMGVKVYDLSLRKPIFMVRITPPPSYYFAFAISPDGSKLAILNDGDVSMCAVAAQ